MELRNLRAVIKVAETQSFKVAAEQMNMTQPTLSRLISQLETELDIRLFRRGWSGAEVTPQGELIYEYAAQIDKATSEAETALKPLIAPLSKLSLGQIAVISAVRIYGGASAAAGALGKSQPAVSRVLAESQHLVGTPLFKRTRDGLEAYPVAIQIAKLHTTLTTIIDSLTFQLEQKKDPMAGRITLGIMAFSSHDLIAKVFAYLGNEYPNARLGLVPGTYASLVESLRRNEIEGIVGLMRHERCPADLAEHPLLQEQFSVIARDNHPVHQLDGSLESLKNQTWIVPPHGSPVRRYFEDLFSRFEQLPSIQTNEIHYFPVAENILLESNAIGIQTYTGKALRELKKGLKPVQCNLPKNKVHVGLTTLKRANTDPLFNEFLRLLEALKKDFQE